jgi:hypothetical protein
MIRYLWNIGTISLSQIATKYVRNLHYYTRNVEKNLRLFYSIAELRFVVTIMDSPSYRAERIVHCPTKRNIRVLNAVEVVNAVKKKMHEFTTKSGGSIGNVGVKT